MQIHRPGAGIVAVGDGFPSVAAVPTGDQAAHFDGAVHILGIVGVQGQADNPLDDGVGVHGDVGELDVFGVALLPGSAAILGTADAAAVVAGVHNIRVPGMRGQGPDIARGGIGGFPMAAAIVAAIDPGLGAGVDDGRILGMYQQGAHLRLRRQSLSDAFPMVGTVGLAIEAAAAQGPLPGIRPDQQRPLAGDAYIKMGLTRRVRHNCPSRKKTAFRYPGLPPKIVTGLGRIANRLGGS